MAPSMSLTETLRLLITANHILHYHEIVDGFGHISVRNPHDPSTFYMSAQIAPGIVKSPDDIVLYYVANGTSVDPNAPTGYAERFIHSEVLRQWPCVGSVVHAHADEVLPFTIVEGVQMEAAFHMAGFIGAFVISSYLDLTLSLLLEIPQDRRTPASPSSFP